MAICVDGPLAGRIVPDVTAPRVSWPFVSTITGRIFMVSYELRNGELVWRDWKRTKGQHARQGNR